MSTLEALVLGVVQGLTEFLPISSSGHLRIVPALLGWDDPGAGFTAVIQLGTMAAVLIYFRADLWRIASACLRELRVPYRRAQPRGEPRLVHRPRHDPDLDLRLRLQGPDRVRRAQPLPDRLGADPLLLRDAPRRARRHAAAGAGGDGRPRRPLHRDRPGAGADPGRLALGGDDLRRPASAASTGSPPPATRSCSRSRPSSSAACSSCARSAKRANRLGRGDDRRDPRRLRHRLRRDRLAAPLPRRPLARVFVVYRIALGVLVLRR